SDGTEHAPTSKPLSKRRRNYAKMNASFAASPTRYRKPSLSWIPLVLCSTPIKRRLTTRVSLRKTWLLRTFASESSTQTTWRDYARSERLRWDAGFHSNLNNARFEETASTAGS